MVSAQSPGNYKIYVTSPAGVRKLVAQMGSSTFGPGGSVDGVIANTPEKWSYLPLSPFRLAGGYKVEFVYQGAANAIDVSDSAISIPCIINGNADTIGNSAHATGIITAAFTTEMTAADVTPVVNVETVMQVLRLKEGQTCQIGGGRCFMSWETG
jgi:hypothetical protein